MVEGLWLVKPSWWEEIEMMVKVAVIMDKEGNFFEYKKVC